jgi:hypothetical protein
MDNIFKVLSVVFCARSIRICYVNGQLRQVAK